MARSLKDSFVGTDDMDISVLPEESLPEPLENSVPVFSVGSYCPIPLEHIIDDTNIRLEYDKDLLLELGNSIKKDGLLQPITVYFSPEKKKYIVVTGNRRYKASILVGLSEIKCVVMEKPVDVDVTQLIENIQRVDLSPEEQEKAVSDLYERVQDIGKICVLLKKNTKWVKDNIKASLLREEVPELKGKDISSETVATLATVEPEKIKTIVDELENEGKTLSRANVKEKVDKVVKGKPPKTTAPVPKSEIPPTPPTPVIEIDNIDEGQENQSDDILSFDDIVTEIEATNKKTDYIEICSSSFTFNLPMEYAMTQELFDAICTTISEKIKNEKE